MITNLPLLFVKGNPKSLYKMTVEELECFVPFLVHCSWGHDTAKNIDQPTWWPSNVPYSNPLVRPKISLTQWAAKLRDIIKLCYKHHCSDFLLKFCEELAKNPPSSLLYVNNCDSTTSLYLKATHRLLVTFRNENILYDRKTVQASRKCLLPQRQISGSSIVESETVNIYLCDTCDETFENLEVLQEHEKACVKQSEGDPSEMVEFSRLSPEPEPLDSSDQNGFLKALGLFNTASGSCSYSPVKCDSKLNNSAESRQRRTMVNGLINFPFSSKAGLNSNKNRQHSYETIERQRELIDRYCSAPACSSESSKWIKQTSRHFPVRYKKPDGTWPRTQIFPNQRRKLLLDIDSQLLYLKCKPCKVIMDKMSEEDIKNYKAELAARAAENEANHSSDNDIEFVSFTSLDDTMRKKQKVSDDEPPSESTCFIEIEIPFDVIDLCSDDDDQNENVHPTPDPHRSPSESNMNSDLLQQLNRPSSLDFDAQFRPSGQTHISKSQMLNVRDPEHSRLKPLQQCHDNLYSSHLSNVISID